MHIILAMIDPVPRPEPSLYEYWMLPVFLVVFIFLAYVRVTYPKRMQLLLRGMVNMRSVQTTMRDELLLSHRASGLFTVTFVLMTALTLYMAGVTYENRWLGTGGIVPYGGLVLVVAAAYTVKLVTIKIVQWIFRTEQPLQEYLFNVFLLNKVLGLALLVVNLFLCFDLKSHVPIWLNVAVGLFALMWLMRIARGLVLAAQYRIGLLYIILYLCALEILPLLLIVKVVFLND